MLSIFSNFRKRNEGGPLKYSRFFRLGPPDLKLFMKCGVRFLTYYCQKKSVNLPRKTRLRRQKRLKKSESLTTFNAKKKVQLKNS